VGMGVCGSPLSLHTTVRKSEIRGLRWRDIDSLERTLTVRDSKTEAGKRAIPKHGVSCSNCVEVAG
jgi:integrase